MQDKKLMELMNSDPDRAMRIAVETYSGLVFSIVRGRLRPPLFTEEDVEECAADAFVEFWRDRARIDVARGSVKSWLAKLALHNALDRLRRARRDEGKVPLDGLAEMEDGLRVELDYESKAERERLIEAVEALGRPDSELIVRKYFLGQSSKETAEQMGLSVSNVDTRTHRAIKKLRKLLGGKEDEKE